MHRNEFEARLVSKAWQDPAFCPELKHDPKAVVARELAALKGGSDIKLPADLKVTVLEETPDQMYLVLPLNPLDSQAGLTGDQLQAVAGVPSGSPTPRADAPALVSVVTMTQSVIGPTLDVVQVVQMIGPLQVVIAGPLAAPERIA